MSGTSAECDGREAHCAPCEAGALQNGHDIAPQAPDTVALDLHCTGMRSATTAQCVTLVAAAVRMATGRISHEDEAQHGQHKAQRRRDAQRPSPAAEDAGNLAAHNEAKRTVLIRDAIVGMLFDNLPSGMAR